MTDDPTQHFLIGIAADAADFMRHQCPRCGLDFKLKGAPADQHDALSWWLQQTVREAGTGAEEGPAEQATSRTYCPYCANAGRLQDFVHPEVLRYIRRIARREIVEPMIASLFQDFTSGLRSSKHMKVTVSQPSGRSPRPISGPEPDDQVVVVCLLCEQHFKVDESWRGSVHCAQCAAELAPQ